MRLAGGFATTVWLTLALAGCTTCKDLGPPAFATCAVPEGGWPDASVGYDPYGSIPDVDISGPVLEAGDGTAPYSCIGGYEAVGGWIYLPRNTDRTWWLVVSDESGQRWTVEVLLPHSTRRPKVGEVVHVRFSWEWGEWTPPTANFELRDGDDDLVVWAGEDEWLGGLKPPAELELVGPGLPACGNSDECGSWARYALEVRVSGSRGVVPLGGDATVGGLRVYNGDLEATSTTSHCSDWGGGHALAAAARK